MLSSSLRTVCLACGAYLIVLTSVPAIWGQDATPPVPEAKPEAAQTEPSPSDAKPEAAKVVEEPKAAPEPQPAPAPEPAAPPPQAPPVPAAAPVPAAPPELLPFDYTQLAHPNVGDQLELTDEQRAAAALLVNERATQLAGATPEQRKSVLDASDQKLAALLNEVQRAKLVTLAAEQKLRFSFRFQKWDDVLDWFARQAGLALVMDQPPPGAFTYSDNRSYSPTEAIDLLNSVLLTKGFSLIQRGRMLILVDLSQDLPLNLIPRVAPEEMSQHGKFEIISVQFPLGRRPADGVEKEIKPLMGKYGSCVALPQTGQLLVTETAGKMQAISILIASIPEPPLPKEAEKPKEKPAPPPPILGVYPVTVIKPATAVETLSILFPNAKFTVDDKADQVMAYATPNDQAGIKAAVDQMQSNRPADQQPRLEVYPVDTLADATQLVEQLKVVAPEAQATFDETLGRLLVFAEPKDQDAVKEVFQKLGTSIESGARQVMVYQPKHFDPTALATLIKQLAPRADVSTDVALRRVVVGATPANQTMIKSLVDQLDQESAIEDQPLLQVYPLEKPLDATIVPSLTALVPDAKVTVSTDGRQLLVMARVVDQTVIKKMVEQWKEAAQTLEEPALKIYPLEKVLTASDVTAISTMVPGVQATLSTDGRRLTVVARAADQEAVKALVDELTAAADQQAKPALKIHPLGSTFTAAEVANLQSLVPTAKITLSTDGRQLNVVALADDQQEIATLIQELDEAAAKRVKPQLTIYSLTRTFAAADVANLQSLVPNAKFTLSTNGRELNVLALAEEQQEVAALIEELDDAAADRVKPRLSIYQLSRTFTAADVTSLQTLVPGATVTLSTDGRQLNVLALDEHQAEIEKIIQEMDEAAAKRVKPEMAVYPLGKPLNPTIMATLQTLVPEATVSMSVDGKQLIVVARADDQAVLKKTLDQIAVSAGGAGGQRLEIYQVNGLSAAELQNLLQPLVISATITLDAPQDRLIVWGPEQEQAAFADVVAKLQQNPLAGTKPLLEFYPLEDESLLTKFSSVLTTLAPTAKVTWDEEGQRVMVVATPKDQKIVQETLQQITQNAQPVEKQILRLYTLNPVQRTRFEAVQVDVLKDFPSVRVIKDPQTGELAIWAKASQHEKLAEVLDQLKTTGEGTVVPLLIAYPINRGSAKVVQEMLLQLFPTTKITVDEKSDRVLVYAALSEHGRIKQTIAQLDSEATPNNQEEIRSYAVGDVDPTPILPMLQKLVPDMQLTIDLKARKVVASGTIRDHESLAKAIEQFREVDPAERPIVKAYAMQGRSTTSLFYMRSVLAEVVPEAVITIDPRGGSIVASGSAEDHEKLKAAIEEVVKLDQASNLQLETYTTDKITATQAITTLTQVVPDAKISAGVDPRQIVVWASPEDQERVKASLAKLEESAGGDGQRVLQLHRIRPAVGAQIATFIARTLPDLQLLSGQGTDRLLVWGTPKDQTRLQELIEQMDSELGLDQQREMKTYELGEVTPTEARRVLDSAIGQLEYVTSTATDRLVIWADAATHVEVAKLLEELKKAVATPQQMIKVHRFEADELDVATVYAALSPADIKGLTIQVNPVTNSLIVRGPADRQVELSETLVHLVDQLPTAEKATAEVYRLDRADPYAASIMIRSLLPAVPVAVDVANRTLAITAVKKDHVKIREVLDQLDSNEGGDLTVETYIMKRANPTAVMAAIQPVVPRAKISSDIYNKMLIVTATAEEHEQIKAIVAQADDRGEGEQSTKAYPLKYANPYTISVALQTVVPGATVSADALNKMLIVTASAKDHERIQAVLDQADMRGGGDLETKAYVLRMANPATISVALSSVVPDAKVSADVTNQMLIVTASKEDHVRVQTIVDEADRKSEGEVTTEVYALNFANPLALSYSIKPIAPNATCSPDSTNKTLIVTATAKDHERIKTVIDQADKRGGGDLITTAYSMKWANPAIITTALTAVVPNATISSDVYNKMLIVTANKEDHAKIKAVIDQADKRGGGDLITRTYTLQTANPSTIMVALLPIVPDAKVSSDVVNRMLIVTASEEDHLKIAAIVDDADRKSEGDRTTVVYALKWANPSALSYSLSPIAPSATVSPDVTNKTLIVTATEKDHARIKAVVDQADQRGGGELTTKAYVLKWAYPATVAAALTTVVPDAKVSPDVYNKMLIVTASDEDHTRIQDVLDQADQRGGGELTTKAYLLKWANPAIIASSLTTVVPDAKISSDVYNKMLLVTANAEDHVKIQGVLEQADQLGGGELTTKAYPLKWANPAIIASSLTTVVPDAKISTDVYNKMLLVTANAEDHKKIQGVLDQADQLGGGELSTKAYSLKWAYPATVAASLTTVVPNAKISPDVYNKSLIVTANADDHEKIQEVLEQVDQRGGGELTTKAFVLKWANPAIIATSLTTVVPDAKISSDVYNKMLLVTANAEDLKKIEAIIAQADTLGGGDLTTKAYPLKWAYAPTVATSLATVVPDAKISPDTYNKMLIVTANADDHKKIQEVLDQADQRGGGEQTTKSYALKWANASTISTALASVVPDAKISADPTNKMLIVTANVDDHTKIQEVVDQADRRGGGDLITKTYALRRTNPSTIMTALTPILPDARMSADPTNRVLIVTAAEEDHVRVKTIVDETDSRGGGELVTEAYSLQWANPVTLVSVLNPVVPDAIVSPDAANKTLVVTASAADQLLVKKVVDQADRRGEGEMTTEVYLLTRANPLSVQRALEPLVPNATIGSDATSKTLIISAPAAEQEKIKKIVERADRRGEGDLITKVYPFKLASPTTAATALQTLIPNALLSPDVATNTLIVTGSAEDHQQVEPLVRELDVASPTTRVLKPYHVQYADPQQVYTSLTQLFRTNREVSVGFQEDTGMILVFATAVDQDEVSRAIADIDKATAGRPKATLEVYSLEGYDGDAAIASLTALLADETPKIELQIDDNNNQVLAIAEPVQHEMIRKALSQLTPQQRDVEVYTLQRVDPYAAESAISTLFEDLPFAAQPSVEADPDSQQLIVRATKSQLERIKVLLEKMGEAAVEQSTQQSSSMLRVIPLSGNVDSTLREIQRIWPQVRGNEIQIITPPRRRFQPAEETPAPDQPEASPQPTGPPANQTPPAGKTDVTPPATEPEKPSPPPPPASDPPSEKGAQLTGATAMFVSAQFPLPTEEPAPTAETPTAETAADSPTPPAAPVADPPPPAQVDAAMPPIVVIATEGRLTIASRDVEALNQFEELMTTLQRGRRVAINNGNFSMFLLQNAAAKDLATTLTELFRQGSRGSRGDFGSFRRRSTNLMVVADERMNALLVYGSVADRAVVEQMLDVLDSVDIRDSLSAERPSMIPIKNLPANTILTVLTSVYKTQLTARRSLQPVTIPQGISPEMTAMLELLNATANSPILTLDADETTNSIVMRAPRQLGEEIEAFVTELDEQAKDGGKRNISLVPLKGMNAEQIEDALRLLMRGGRFRRGGG